MGLNIDTGIKHVNNVSFGRPLEDKKYMLPSLTLNAFVSPRSGHKPMTLGQIAVLSEDHEARPPSPKRGHHQSPNRLRVGYN